MKSHVLATIAAAALVAPLAAQSPQTPPSPQTPTSAAAATTTGDSKTITGCVAPAADNRGFTLSESSSAATTPPNPSAASAAMAGAGRWSLTAKSDVDLSKYVGKRVEITGSPDNKGGASADHAQSPTRSDAAAGQRFHVKSVRVIAETCS